MLKPIKRNEKKKTLYPFPVTRYFLTTARRRTNDFVEIQLLLQIDDKGRKGENAGFIMILISLLCNTLSEWKKLERYL